MRANLCAGLAVGLLGENSVAPPHHAAPKSQHLLAHRGPERLVNNVSQLFPSSATPSVGAQTCRIADAASSKHGMDVPVPTASASGATMVARRTVRALCIFCCWSANEPFFGRRHVRRTKIDFHSGDRAVAWRGEGVRAADASGAFCEWGATQQRGAACGLRDGQLARMGAGNVRSVVCVARLSLDLSWLIVFTYAAFDEHEACVDAGFNKKKPTRRGKISLCSKVTFQLKECLFAS